MPIFPQRRVQEVGVVLDPLRERAVFQPIPSTAAPTAQALPGFANFARSYCVLKKSGPRASTTQSFLMHRGGWGLLACTQRSATVPVVAVLGGLTCCDVTLSIWRLTSR